jgi:hypothetical protein
VPFQIERHHAQSHRTSDKYVGIKVLLSVIDVVFPKIQNLHHLLGVLLILAMTCINYKRWADGRKCWDASASRIVSH